MRKEKLIFFCEFQSKLSNNIFINYSNNRIHKTSRFNNKIKAARNALSGFSGQQPRLITMELIAEAIAEYKQEKQIFSLEITQTNCTELALSFKKLLKISNLDIQTKKYKMARFKF